MKSAGKMAWKMAWRDARKHLTRTILAILLIAVPISAGTAKVALQMAEPTVETISLKDVPEGAQARILAQPRSAGNPVRQPYHGQMGIQNYMGQMAAAPERIAPHLDAQNQLTQFWISPNVLAKNGSHIAILKITEADAKIMPLLTELPAAAKEQLTQSLAAGGGAEVAADPADTTVSGTATPSTPNQTGTVPTAAPAVLNQSAANYLNAKVGDQITVTGAPAKFDPGAEGAFNNKHTSYRIAAILPDENPGTLPKIWAAPGWVKDTLAGIRGVFGNYLVTGPQPVTWEQIKKINQVGAIVYSRHVILNPPPESERYPVEIDPALLTRSITDLAITIAIGVLLALFLLTPAFTVSAEQASRSLAMIAVTGGTSRQLRRIITRQGSLVGLLGGTLGALGGLVLGTAGLGLIAWQNHRAEKLDGLGKLDEFQIQPLTWMQNFTWWLIPVAILVGLLCGWISSVLPAFWVSRNNLLVALTGHAANPHTRPLHRWLPIILLLLGGGAWVGLLRYARNEIIGPDQPDLPSTTYLLSGLVSGLGTLLFILGLIAAIPHLFYFLSSGPREKRGGLAWRLAIRDAAIHRRRVVPVSAAIIMVVVLYISGATTAATWNQFEDDVNGRLMAAGRILVAPKIPLDEDFNRDLIDKTREALGKELPIVGHADLYNAETVTASAERLRAAGAGPWRLPEDAPASSESDYVLGFRPGESCPKYLYSTLDARQNPAHPLTCTERVEVSGAGSYGELELPEYPVFDGAAMRATGLPGAEEAAKVLDAGGLVVAHGYAYDPATGQAWVRVEGKPGDNGRKTATEAAGAVGEPVTQAFPGAFVYNLESRTGFVPSPELAKRLGYSDIHLYGQILVLDESASGLTLEQLEEAWSKLGDLRAVMTYLVPKETAAPPWWLVHALRIGLLSLLFATVWISLVLSRTQMRADLATLAAVGAPPSFARRYATAQAAILLLLSTVLGAVAGMALSWAQFRLQMNFDDGVYRVAVPWTDLLILAVPGPVVILGLVWLTSKVRLPLAARSRD